MLKFASNRFWAFSYGILHILKITAFALSNPKKMLRPREEPYQQMPYHLEREQTAVQSRRRNRQDIFNQKRAFLQRSKEQIQTYNLQVLEEGDINEKYINAPYTFKDDFDNLLEGLFDDNVHVVLQSVTGIRIILTEQDIRVEQLIQCKIIPILLKLTQFYSEPQIQHEAIWAINNLAAKAYPYVLAIVEAEGIEILFNALENNPLQVTKMTIMAFSNLACDCPEVRDMILDRGVCDVVTNLLNNEANNKEFLNEGLSLLAVLCRSQPLPLLSQVQQAVSTICVFLSLNFDIDPVVITECLWALVYHCPAKLESPVVQTKILQKYLPICFVGATPQEYLSPLARLTANFALGEQQCIEFILNLDALYDFLWKCLNGQSRWIRTQICWFISNLFTGTPDQINTFINRGHKIWQKLLIMFKTDHERTRSQIAFIYSNYAVRSKNPQINELYHQLDLMDCYIDLLQSDDNEVLENALRSLKDVLQQAQKQTQKQKGKEQPYSDLLVDLYKEGGITLIEQMQRSQNTRLYEMSMKFLVEFMEVDECMIECPRQQKQAI